MPRPIYLASAFALAGVVIPWASLGQEPIRNNPSVFEIPFAGGFPGQFQVSEVDPGGVAKVVNQSGLSGRMLPLVEGYYLMLVPTGGRGTLPRLYRVQVSDVGFGVLTLQIGAETAGTIRAGERFFLWRPEGSTTAQLRGLPAIIPVSREEEKPAELKVPQDQAVALGQSLGKLRKIGWAFNQFENDHGFYPPAIIRGPDGKPWHSWRVLLLPYLGQEAIYQAYDFSEPWDSGKNLKVLDRMPEIYRDGVYPEAPGHFTHFGALVGEGIGPRVRGRDWNIRTIFSPSGLTMKDPKSMPFERPPLPKSRPAENDDVVKNVKNLGYRPIGLTPPGRIGIASITDGTSVTAVIASMSPDRKVPWTKPEDIVVDAEFPIELNKPNGIAAPYLVDEAPEAHRAALMLFADGTARAITDRIRPETLLALLSINGGEVVSLNPGPIPFAFPTPEATQSVPKLLIDCDKGRATLVNSANDRLR